ncbi:MAG: hypothetical protein AAGA58_07065 [Verrucomicrobiota bacterium]
MREWKSADGTKTIRGELVKQEGENVVLKREDGKVFDFPRDLLSEEDQNFLKQAASGAGGTSPNFLAAINKLEFGQTPEQVTEVLKGAPGVEGGVNKFFEARMGLNGMYFTTVAGVRYDFFFEFDDKSKLTEISLRSSPYDEGELRGKFQAAWRNMRTEIRKGLGAPAITTELPPLKEIDDNTGRSTDIWDTPSRGYYLGLGKADGGITCNFRSRRESYLKDAIEVKDKGTGKGGGVPSVIDL